MTDNWNPNGPIVVWENYGNEGWQPRSYATLAEATAKAGITTSHVVTMRVDLANHVREPAAVPPLYHPDDPFGPSRPLPTSGESQ